MTDYRPDPSRNDPKRGYDKYGNAPFEMPDDSGRGPYVLLGLLAMIGLIGGLMYFTGAPRDGSNTAHPATTPTTQQR